MNEDKKFFDVSKPRTVGPDPTSKPVIVGHQPTMPADPMLRGDTPQTDTPQNMGEISISHDTPVAPPAAQPEVSDLPPTAKIPDEPPHGSYETQLPAGKSVHHHRPRIWVWIIIVLVLLASIYAAVDAKTNLLPLHIFPRSDKTSGNSSANISSQSQAITKSTVPTGFSSYQVTGTTIEFDYPTSWGEPTTAKDSGFSQRGTGKTSDGVHAYIIHFATNKDVEVAVTSSKYLPVARAALYYDYLQWCSGTNDGKFYKESLHFTTANGIDTSGTVACDQGPLTDASKISNALIVQNKTKDASGADLGDVYTANLNVTGLPVLRVKDIKMVNADDIKILVSSIATTPQ